MRSKATDTFETRIQLKRSWWPKITLANKQLQQKTEINLISLYQLYNCTVNRCCKSIGFSVIADWLRCFVCFERASETFKIDIYGHLNCVTTFFTFASHHIHIVRCILSAQCVVISFSSWIFLRISYFPMLYHTQHLNFVWHIVKKTHTHKNHSNNAKKCKNSFFFSNSWQLQINNFFWDKKRATAIP